MDAREPPFEASCFAGGASGRGLWGRQNEVTTIGLGVTSFCHLCETQLPDPLRDHKATRGSGAPLGLRGTISKPAGRKSKLTGRKSKPVRRKSKSSGRKSKSHFVHKSKPFNGLSPNSVLAHWEDAPTQKCVTSSRRDKFNLARRSLGKGNHGLAALARVCRFFRKWLAALIALAVDPNNSETSWPGLSRLSTRLVSDMPRTRQGAQQRQSRRRAYRAAFFAAASTRLAKAATSFLSSGSLISATAFAGSAH
jgi:hypothetical protein